MCASKYSSPTFKIAILLLLLKIVILYLKLYLTFRIKSILYCSELQWSSCFRLLSDQHYSSVTTGWALWLRIGDALVCSNFLVVMLNMIHFVALSYINFQYAIGAETVTNAFSSHKFCVRFQNTKLRELERMIK